MKNLPLLTLAIIITTLLFSCRPDEYTEVGGEVTPIGGEPTTIVQSNLQGVVVNQDMLAIANAQVSISGEIAETDENGVFSFQNIDLSSDGSLLKISKEGFFDGFQFTSGQAGKYSHTKTTLVKKVEQSFDSSTGGTIVANGGSSVSFEANSMSSLDGQAYQGEVIISSHWYDPSSDDLIYSMPGDLRAIDENNEAVQLQTYGMMAVELRSPAGEELQLSNDKTATIKVPISNGSDATSYESIPTWHLDEATGIWIEEGNSQVEGNFLVAEVSHFSFWNYDVPFRAVNLSGIMVSDDGLPLAFQTVVIKDNNNNVSRSGQTNEIGFFSGLVPAGVDLTMSLFTCAENHLVRELGVLTQDLDLGEIINTTLSRTLLTGTLVDCNQEIIRHGYAKIINPDETQTIVPLTDGVLSYTFLYCNEGEVTFLAYDYNSSKVSDPISVSISQDDVELGFITICEEILGEYIHYFINDETHNVPLNNFDVFYADDRMLYISSYGDPDPSTSSPGFMIKYDVVQEIAQYYVTGFSNTVGYLETGGEDLEIQISAIQAIGDMISITFDNGEFRGEMNVELDEIVESGVVNGKVWLDENQNGIKDAGEPPLEGRKMRLSYQGVTFPFDNYLYGSSYYPHPLNLPYSVISDSDGNFTFTGVFVEKELKVYYFTQPGEEVTLDNVGNDEWVDSDFYFVAGGTNQQYDCETFIIGDGGEKSDIGLGIK